jgi:NitT/TauT family transport system ATP-binding protein
MKPCTIEASSWPRSAAERASASRDECTSSYGDIDVAPKAATTIVARDVDITFDPGVDALAHVNVTIEAGSFVSIVGPSGCGKSTFLRLVSGLIQASRGRIEVDGVVPAEARRLHRNLSYVLQDATLLDWRPVATNVALPLELRGIAQSEVDERVEACLQLVGLQDMAHLYPHQLSGGMRMRVSIARALVTEPGLLLMDEPFGALDEISRQRLNHDLLALWCQRQWTCLFVTHSVQEAVFLSQRVMVMTPRPGQIRAVHEVDFPYPRPRSLRTDPAFGRLVARVSEDLVSEELQS